MSIISNKIAIFSLSIALVLSLLFAFAPAALAQKSAVCEGAGAVQSGSACAAVGEVSVNTVLRLAVNILSWTAGVIAVVMVIISGMKYSTSGGDSGKVAGAKRTLIYALIGAGVATVAQTIVRYVVKTL